MSELGFAILHRRANKLRHRSDRPLKRHHRSNSFEDASDPHGLVIQHPTDKYESDQEEDSDAEAERVHRERMARIKAQQAAQAAGQAPPPARSTVPLTPIELRAYYESRLNGLNNEIRDYETKLRKVEPKLKTMNQWKWKALKSKEFNPYDMVESYRIELTEATKVRYYDAMIRKSVGRNLLRNFRLRKMIKHIHRSMADIVERYLEQRSGLAQQAHAEELHQTQLERQRQERQTQVTKESYELRPGTGIVTHTPYAPAHMAPVVNPLTGLPSSLPPFAPSTRTMVGSLTDDTVSSRPMSILTSAMVIPGSEKLALQSELVAWMGKQQEIIKNGYRKKVKQSETITAPPFTNIPTSTMTNTNEKRFTNSYSTTNVNDPTSSPSYASTSSTSSSNDPSTSSPSSSSSATTIVPTGLHDLMSCLSDGGPIFRCMIEELLNGFGESQRTWRSFDLRTKELSKKLEEDEGKLKTFEEEHQQLETYLHLQLSTLHSLIDETRQVDTLLNQHQRYVDKLTKVHSNLQTQRDRRKMDLRKLERSEQIARGNGRSITGTGGIGISSHLLEDAKMKRRQEEEKERITLLREIMKQQEMAMQTVAQSAAEMNAQAIRENNPEFYAVGNHSNNAHSSASNTQPHASSASVAPASSTDPSSLGASPPNPYPPGLSELIRLLDDGSISTPYFDQYLQRKHKEIAKGLIARGVRSQHDAGAISDKADETILLKLTNHFGKRDNNQNGNNNLDTIDGDVDRTTTSTRDANVASPITAAAVASPDRRPRSISPTRQRNTNSRTPNSKPSPSSTRHTEYHHHGIASAALPTSPPPPPAPAQSTLQERLDFHNGMSAPLIHIPTPAPATPPAASTYSYPHAHSQSNPSMPLVSPTDFIRTLPLAAYPRPQTVKPINVPQIHLPSNHHHQPHLYVPTQLIGGLTLQSREKEMYRLKNSPYMVSTLMTPQEEMAAIEDITMAPKRATTGISRNATNKQQRPSTARPATTPAAAAASASIKVSDDTGVPTPTSIPTAPSPPARDRVSARGSRPLKAALSHGQSMRIRMVGTGVAAGDSLKIARQKLAQQKLRLEKTIYEPQLFEGQNY